MNNILTPEALPILTVGLYIMLVAVAWSIKTLYVEIKNKLKK